MKGWLDVLFKSVVLGLVAALLLLVLFPKFGGEALLNRFLDGFKTEKFQVSYADAVDKAGPTVVSVFTKTDDENGAAKSIGQGSGVIIDANGHVVTNYHVVQGTSEITVVYQDGLPRSAKLIGVDAVTDLAVLKTDLENVPHVELSTAASVRVGDVVLAIGNPRVGQSVSMGIVSAKGRVLGAQNFGQFIQTDAAINHGNSGGGLFNAEGELIGINSSFFSEQSTGIGFALPVSLVEFITSKIIRDGKVIRGWLGVTGGPLPANLANSLGLLETGGVQVTAVSENSPAAKAGLKVNDYIVRINGEAIGEISVFVQWLSTMEPGTDLVLEILRIDPRGQRQQLHIPVTLINIPSQ